MASIADLTVQIKADIDDFESKMGQVDSGLGKVSGLAKVAAAGLAAAGAAIIGLGVQSLRAAGDIQALEKGFAATYKGSEDLSVALAKVKELAKLPGLGLKEALQGATNLQAAGFSADLATRALGAFGNALATVGRGKADLDGVGLALGQIASKGKISAEEINQLAERVPQIRQAMIAAFGSADTQVLQKAKISATDFVEGVTRELEKLPKVTGGLNNAFENFSDAVTVALAKAGTSINNAFNIEGLVGLATDALTRLGDAFAALEPSFRAVAAYFGPSGEGGQLFRQLADSVGNATTEIKGAFDALSGAESSTSIVKELLRSIVVGFTAAADVIGGVIGTITRALKGDFAGAEVQAQRALNALTAPIRDALGLTTQLSGSFDAAFRNIGGGFDGVGGAVGYFGTATTKATVAVAGMSKELEKQLKTLQDLDKGFSALGARTTKGTRPQDAPEFIEPPKTELGALPKQLQGLSQLPAQLKGQFSPIYGALAEFNSRSGEILGAGIGNLVDTFFQGLGQLATGGITVEQFGGGLLGIIGQVCTQLGQAVIAVGIGMLGLKTAFTNPFAALAAGAALLVVGSALSSIASSAVNGGPASGGGGGGGGSLASSPRNSFTPTVAPTAATQGPAKYEHTVKFNLTGSQLTGALAFETDRIGRVVRR